MPFPLLDPPAWCPGPAGWRVLVSPSNRPLVCGEALRGAGQPSQILPIKAASRGGWLLYHSLRWQGTGSLDTLFISYFSPHKGKSKSKVLCHAHRWIIKQMIGWWRTWIRWMTTWHHFSTSRQIILSPSFGRRVRLTDRHCWKLTCHTCTFKVQLRALSHLKNEASGCRIY